MPYADPKSATRVLLDPDNDKALALAAALLGSTKSALIRHHVSAFLADPVNVGASLQLPGLAAYSEDLKAHLSTIPKSNPKRNPT